MRDLMIDLDPGLTSYDTPFLDDIRWEQELDWELVVGVGSVLLVFDTPSFVD